CRACFPPPAPLSPLPRTPPPRGGPSSGVVWATRSPSFVFVLSCDFRLQCASVRPLGVRLTSPFELPRCYRIQAWRAKPWIRRETGRAGRDCGPTAIPLRCSCLIRARLEKLLTWKRKCRNVQYCQNWKARRLQFGPRLCWAYFYFETLLAEDEECRQCFRQFRSLCTTLLLPMEGIVSDSAKSIQSIVDRDTNVARKYGYAGGHRWNAISAAEIFEPVLAYWEKRMDSWTPTRARSSVCSTLASCWN
ncbi:PREDICTED: uncharacterized protein LOC105567796, partial [Vollenhovia emeryi]|uniref:uncharacterized protein LOC105567796 n=1 Tax=Vollenhovia emeryi TaxID=411798 RepID=UPI0005F51E57